MRVYITEAQLDGIGDELWEELEPRTEKALAEGAQLIVDAAQLNLRRRRGTGRSTAPAGEAPEFDTGELHDSVKLLGKVRRSKYQVRQGYGSQHPASILHEYGGLTKGGVGGVPRRYPARPYLRPAEEQTREAVEARLDAL